MKKVLLVHSDLFLLSGVESLLTQEKDLDLVNAQLTDREGLIKTIQQSKPNVIICDESIRFSDEPILCNLINSSPEIRLLIVGVKNNHMLVYEKQNVSITGSKDLVTAIRGNSH